MADPRAVPDAGVSVAGYHEHFVRRLQIARRHLSAEALLVHIRAVYAANRGAYGWPRIWRELRAQGIRVGKQRVQRLMRQHGIRARGKRSFRVTTTDSRHGLPIAPNLLHRNFAVAAPNRAWSGDITYIPTNEGWLFLAVVLDLFSRRVVGWSMQPEMRSNLVIDALEMDWSRRSPDRNAGPIFHSDRGSQYASHEFGGLLVKCGITASMSRRGDCWDNAPSETLFASLKVERLHGQRFETIRQAKDETLAWLLWYNQTRMHSPRGYLSLIQFEQQCVEQRKQSQADQAARATQAMEKQESKIRFPTFPQPLRLRTITNYEIRILRARSLSSPEHY